MAKITQRIPMDAWVRKPISDLFTPTSPYYAMTFRTDVTRLYTAAKREGLSVYALCVYAVMRAVNRVDAFLWKFDGDAVVRYAYLSPSLTAPADGGLFKIVNVEWQEDETPAAFSARMQTALHNATRLMPSDADEARQDFAYLSCVPWVDFMTLTHETPYDGFESAPRIAWGKIVEQSGARSMAMGVQVNHRLIDGRHIAAFADALQQECDALLSPECGKGRMP